MASNWLEKLGLAVHLINLLFYAAFIKAPFARLFFYSISAYVVSAFTVAAWTGNITDWSVALAPLALVWYLSLTVAALLNFQPNIQNLLLDLIGFDTYIYLLVKVKWEEQTDHSKEIDQVTVPSNRSTRTSPNSTSLTNLLPPLDNTKKRYFASGTTRNIFQRLWRAIRKPQVDASAGQAYQRVSGSYVDQRLRQTEHTRIDPNTRIVEHLRHTDFQSRSASVSSESLKTWMKVTIFLAVVSTAANIGTMVYNYVTRSSAPSSTETTSPTTSQSAAESNCSYGKWLAEAKKEHTLQYPHATKRDHLLINDIGRFIAENAGHFDLPTIRMLFRGVEDWHIADAIMNFPHHMDRYRNEIELNDFLTFRGETQRQRAIAEETHLRDLVERQAQQLQTRPLEDQTLSRPTATELTNSISRSAASNLTGDQSQSLESVISHDQEVRPFPSSSSSSSAKPNTMGKDFDTSRKE